MAWIKIKKEYQNGGEKEGKRELVGQHRDPCCISESILEAWKIYTHILYIKSELEFWIPGKSGLHKRERNPLLVGEAGLKAWSTGRRQKWISSVPQNSTKSIAIIIPWGRVHWNHRSKVTKSRCRTRNKTQGCHPIPRLGGGQQNVPWTLHNLSIGVSCQKLPCSKMRNTQFGFYLLETLKQFLINSEHIWHLNGSQWKSDRSRNNTRK